MLTTITLAAFIVAAAAPEPGQVAPDFTATATDGRKVTLSELVKEKTVVVAFFPKAFTPG